VSRRILVAAGLIEGPERGVYLITRRPAGSHLADAWEFPGGKIENGESPEAALQRELREELAIEVEVGDVYAVGHHVYPEPGKEVVLLVYRCRWLSGEPRCLGVSAWEWMPAERLADLPMPPADRPVLARLRRELGRP
jgi:8-oxo-dGTP diphosphatase